MADVPIPISDISDPAQIRVKLLASGKDVHAPMDAFNAAAIHGAPTKTTPVENDEIGYWDSVAGRAVKTTWGNFAAASDTYVNAGIYGVGNGIDDDAPKLEAIFASHAGSTVFLPEGQSYKLDTTLDIPSVAGNRLKGAGPKTTLLTTTGNYDGIKFAETTTQQGAGVEDLMIEGTGSRTSGYGINIAHFVAENRIRNVHIRNQWRGFGLASCDIGWIENCIAEQCYSHGFHFRNKDGIASSSLQWLSNFNLSQMNTGNGFLYEAVAMTGFTKTSVGSITGCATFANSSYGLAAVGVSGNTIESVRAYNNFFGQDNFGEIFFDTYGRDHLVNGGFYELSGTSACGRALGTSASSLGIGITTSANNGMINVSGVHIIGNSRDGIFSQADFMSVTGATIVNNGKAGTAGRRNGIYHFLGVMNVNGGFIRNSDGGTAQVYGITTADSTNLTVCGVDLRNNATAALNGATLPSAMVIGCRGTNMYVGEGGIAVGNPTGGATAGAVNVAVNMLKNNTAYTNP